MNKRARNRLIGVTAIIIIAVVAIVAGMASQGGGSAFEKTVADVSKDKSLVGKRVRVSGAVVPGSWNKQGNPMRFTIKAEKDTTGATLKVVYNGATPATFGDGVVAVVTGVLNANGTVESTDMITKCPSKYSSASGAMPVKSLPPGGNMANRTVTGFVKPGSLGKPGSDPILILAEKADGSGATVAVSYAGALPSTIKDGTQLVIKGDLKAGKFIAVEVALESGQK